MKKLMEFKTCFTEFVCIVLIDSSGAISRLLRV